jgi:DNA polymerase-3 subunit alpha
VIEEAGVLKMDFLGLKTLSILKTALELIKQNHDVIIDLDLIPLEIRAYMRQVSLLHQKI